MAPSESPCRELNEPGEWDAALRPTSFDDFIGQDACRQNLKIFVTAARQRGEALDHVLLSGPPGVGKTSLCFILARELGVDIRVTSGPALERPKDLVGLLTSLKAGDILFIDEIHRLPRAIEEYLYAAMEDFAVDVMLDQGPHARSLRLTVKPFTLVGATTREGLLPAPFRGRFGVIEKLDLYGVSELEQILQRSVRLLEVEADQDGIALIAARSRGVPRIANRLLRRLRDIAEVKENGHITRALAEAGLKMLGIDEMGLEAIDRKILATLKAMGGGPVGLKTVAIAVGESDDTIEEVYEPYLIRLGLLERTPRGRRLTDRGCEQTKPGAQQMLFRG
ncbi:MAG: Holliday junction branch migration DNA helicase RuvB [Planctomycetota bacterium]